MRSRRDLLVLLGAAAVAPRIALAQSKPPILIGWLNTGTRELGGHYLTALKEGLSALGMKEGTQYVIEERWTGGRERLQTITEELVAKKPAIIVAAPLPAVIASAKTAPHIPVVQATGTSPVAAKLAASLARPGGMVTGVTSIVSEVSEKFLELLLAAVPKLRRVGFLVDSRGANRAAYVEMARRSATQHSVEARIAEATRPDEIDAAISQLQKGGAQALVVFTSPTLLVERRHILKLALARRWPVIASQREWADDGALLTYGADPSANYRRAAYYVDRILKGAKPGDLPIEQPTQFELIVNLKTAKTLGLTISQSLLFRADKVIE